MRGRRLCQRLTGLLHHQTTATRELRDPRLGVRRDQRVYRESLKVASPDRQVFDPSGPLSGEVASAMRARSSTIWPIVTRSWCAYTRPENRSLAASRRAASRSRSWSCDTKASQALALPRDRGHPIAPIRLPALSVHRFRAGRNGNDGQRHVDVHVEREAQRERFNSANLRRKAGSDTSARSLSASCVPCLIWASREDWFS